jgi:general secretion pathway protein G
MVRGFTLIELLTVIAIIAILSALVFGLGRRMGESGRNGRAVAELAALGAILEDYRRLHGDYPRTNDGARLLQALIGRRDPAAFTFEADRDPFLDEGARLVDPWGRPYAYAYRTPLPWNNPGYLLYSEGPDGRSAPPLAGGFPDQAAPENHDNLYANR